MTAKLAITIELSPSLLLAVPAIAAVRGLRDDCPAASSRHIERLATEAYDGMTNPKFGRKVGIELAASALIDEAEASLLEAVINAVDKADKSSYSVVRDNESEGDQH